MPDQSSLDATVEVSLALFKRGDRLTVIYGRGLGLFDLGSLALLLDREELAASVTLDLTLQQIEARAWEVVAARLCSEHVILLFVEFVLDRLSNRLLRSQSREAICSRADIVDRLVDQRARSLRDVVLDSVDLDLRLVLHRVQALDHLANDLIGPEMLEGVLELKLAIVHHIVNLLFHLASVLGLIVAKR